MPSLEPLLHAGPVVELHATAAGAALLLGIVQLVRPKGTPGHRALGWLWVALMAFIAGGSFLIHGLRQFGPFSWIHLLSIATLVFLVVGIVHARAGRIASHRVTMISLFFGALVIAGLFTLVPGRVMHHVVFGN